MAIKRVIAAKAELKTEIVGLFETEFSIPKTFAENLYDNSLNKHVDQLRDECYFFLETPYVDKVYRDSYYTYFSSKLGNYRKDCIRIAIFSEDINEEDFRNDASVADLNNKFLGFIVIRPTEPNIVGRSVISKKALKNNSFLTLSATLDASVNFVKLEVVGFPHSSQDTETITCAETTLWAVMEYFGFKYAEYKPVLPSDIIAALKKVSAERQIPSKGLNIQQMAFALKEFGFGTRIYSRSQFGVREFKRLFSTYIESGLPIIVAIENRHKGGNIGHAILCIGHETTTDTQIDNLTASVESNQYLANKIQQQQITYYDNDDVVRQFVFIDDNMPVYQLSHFDTPATHYPDTKWHNCEITYFIVPLYPKVYLEAFEAKNFIKQVLLAGFNIANNTELFLRFYLTSSRSYKHSLTLNSSFQVDAKDIILETSMPKFIWVCEVANKVLTKQKKANGLIIVDATEANILGFKPLILAAFGGEMLSFDSTNGILTRKLLPLQTFSIFTSNLKGF